MDNVFEQPDGKYSLSGLRAPGFDGELYTYTHLLLLRNNQRQLFVTRKQMSVIYYQHTIGEHAFTYL